MVLDDSHYNFSLLFVWICVFFSFRNAPQEFIASSPLPNGSLLPPQSLTLVSGSKINVTTRPRSVYSAHILCAAHTLAQSREVRATFSFLP